MTLRESITRKMEENRTRMEQAKALAGAHLRALRNLLNSENLDDITTTLDLPEHVTELAATAQRNMDIWLDMATRNADLRRMLENADED